MDLSRVQPVVLAGGRSRRFGRDKLAAAVGAGGGMLVDVPIGALRAVFGARVALVGDCAEEVRARADLHWADAHPGLGPAGGLLTALERSGADVFVLAGDLARVTAETVRSVLRAAEARPDALAALASAPAVEPCIGLYRSAFALLLRARVEGGALSLHDAVPAARLALARISPEEAWNVNEPGDLPPGLASRPGPPSLPA